MPWVHLHRIIIIIRNNSSWTCPGRSIRIDRIVHRSTAVPERVQSDDRFSDTTSRAVHRLRRVWCRHRQRSSCPDGPVNVSKSAAAEFAALSYNCHDSSTSSPSLFPPERTDYGASPTKTTCVTYSNENTRITCDSGEEIEEVSSSKLDEVFSLETI